jgi:integrase
MATIEKYQTAGGVRYRVRYRTPDKKQTDKRGFVTKRDADAFAATVEVSKLKGEYIPPKIGKTTLGDLGGQWLERQRGILKPSTFHHYTQLWRSHVEPRWGATPISAIRHTDIQSWISGLATTRSASLVVNVHLVLARILDDAVTDRMLVSNPARKVKMPKRPPRRNTYLTAPQLDMLATECAPYGSLILLFGVGGLRWGEAICLRVQDVNFLRQRVELHRNAVTVGGQAVLGTLKSNKSRVVALPKFVIDALARTAEGKSRDDLLWPAPTASGYLTSPGNRRSWLFRAVARCQKIDPNFPRITPHDLRHTAASLAIHGGANPLVVQRMLGHKSAAMTLDVYSDLFESDLASVAESVGKMWARDVKSL